MHRAHLRGDGRRRRSSSSGRRGSSTSRSARWALRAPRCSPARHQLGRRRTGSRSLRACIAGGAVIGAGVELVVVRRLFAAPRVILLVAHDRRRAAAAVLPVRPARSSTRYSAVPDRRSPVTWEIGGVLVRGRARPRARRRPAPRRSRSTLFLNRTKYGHRDPRLGRQRRRRPPLGDQHQADVDARVGARRRARGVGAILVAPLTSATASDVARVRARRCCCACSSPRSSAAWSSLPLALRRAASRSASARALVFYNYTEPARPPRPRAVRRRARDPAASVRRRRGSRTTSRALVVLAADPPDPGRARARWWVRRLPALGVGLVALLVALLPARVPRPAVAAVPVQPRAALRARRAVAHRAHRLGRSALARPVRVRRARRDVAPPRSCATGLGLRPRGAARRRDRDASSRSSSARPALRLPGLFLAVTTLAFAVLTSSWLLRARRLPRGRRRSSPSTGAAAAAIFGDRSLALAGHLLRRLPRRARSSSLVGVVAAPHAAGSAAR